MPVQPAETMQIIVAAAMTAAQPLGRGKPIGRNVGPEELQEGLGLPALPLPARIGVNQEQPVEIRAIVRGTAKLVNPEHRGPDADSVQAAIAFPGRVGAIEPLAEHDQVAGIQDRDVGVVGRHAMPQATFHTQPQQIDQLLLGRRRQPVAMADLHEQGILHAEFDRVGIGHVRIAPTPAEVTPVLAVRVLVLHLPASANKRSSRSG